MDDEEEDMSQPISQLWRTPFRDVKYEGRASRIHAQQALAAVPTPHSHANYSINIGTLPYSLHWQPRVPFHGKEGRGRSQPRGVRNGLNVPHSSQFTCSLRNHHSANNLCIPSRYILHL